MIIPTVLIGYTLGRWPDPEKEQELGVRDVMKEPDELVRPTSSNVGGVKRRLSDPQRPTARKRFADGLQVDSSLAIGNEQRLTVDQ